MCIRDRDRLEEIVLVAAVEHPCEGSAEAAPWTCTGLDRESVVAKETRGSDETPVALALGVLFVVVKGIGVTD